MAIDPLTDAKLAPYLGGANAELRNILGHYSAKELQEASRPGGAKKMLCMILVWRTGWAMLALSSVAVLVLLRTTPSFLVYFSVAALGSMLHVAM